MNNELSVIERAQTALSFDETKAALVPLVEASARIVSITNNDGYAEAQAARMVLKNTRVQIEKRSKAAREDATQFSKAVIAKEKELIAVISPEEDRLQALQFDFDAAIAREKAAKAEAERKRIGALRGRIDCIRAYAIDIADCLAAEIDAQARDLAESVEIGDDFQELREEANTAKAETLDRLRALHAKAVDRERVAAELKAAQEAERARLAALAAELEAKRAEQARIDKIERDRIAAERAEFEAEQASIRAAQNAERMAREADQRRIDKERAEQAAKERAAEDASRRERMQAEAAERAERERITKEEADKVRIAQAAEEQRLRIEREELARQKAAQERAKRQREIESATLIDAANEAHELLLDLAPTHITTAKLGAALSRELSKRAA